MPKRLRRVLFVTLAVLVSGNAAILATFLGLRLAEAEPDLDLAGIHNARVVDAKLLRGDAPGEAGYRALAEHGVSTVVDLRAERGLSDPSTVLDEVGIERIIMPIRDGQTPTAAQTERFVDLVREADGLVYVHCGAGVGRAGTMAATYLVKQGESTWQALGRNLAVGPPSLEQIVYAASLEENGATEQAPEWVEAVSRVFDGPRRWWSIAGF